MKIYIDSDYKCHTTNPENIFREFEVPFFDGKCTAFVEGFVFVPPSETFTDFNGVKYTGEMKAAWKPYSELETAQREYEKQLIAIYEESLKTMGVVL